MSSSPVPDHALELVKPLIGELVTPFIQWVCGALAVGYVLLGWTPLLDPSTPAYDRPLFDSVFSIAAPQAWGAAFMVAAVLLALTAFTGRAGLYLVAIVAATGTIAAWTSTITYTALTNEAAVISSNAVGLFVLNYVALIGLALSPRQLRAERPVIARIERDSNVVELAEVERRGA